MFMILAFLIFAVIYLAYRVDKLEHRLDLKEIDTGFDRFKQYIEGKNN